MGLTKRNRVGHSSLGFGAVLRGSQPFHTPSIPYGGRIGTNSDSLCSIVFDFSGDLSSDRLAAMVYTGFTRQGSEVQILSRLPRISKS
jgi:hypothetical protein